MTTTTAVRTIERTLTEATSTIETLQKENAELKAFVRQVLMAARATGVRTVGRPPGTRVLRARA